jgi:hypothetical protein
MEKIDFKKTLKSLYTAKTSINEVDAGTGIYLAVKGQGAPGGEAYADAIGKIYGVAYTLKFSLKTAGVMDFTVCSLETLYYDNPAEVPIEEWRWVILIRIPEQVTKAQIMDAATALKVRKNLDASDVERMELKEERSLQVMHIGPYNEVGRIYDNLTNHMRENELVIASPPHEIYISDPRRTIPEKLKTIVRIPVK